LFASNISLFQWWKLVFDYNLNQRFTNCGLQPKSGSQSSVKWVTIVFLQIVILSSLIRKF